MSRRALRWPLGLGGVCLAIVAAAEIGFQTLRGFRYPDYDDQGRLRLEIRGDEAHLHADGMILIANLNMTFYEEGKSVMQVASPSCLFDRVNRTAASTAAVTVVRAEVTLTGTGFDWSAESGCLQIRENAKVRLRRSPGPEEPEAGP